MKTLAIRLDDDLHAQLSVVAQLGDLTVTDAIRQAIEQWIERQRSAPELTARANRCSMRSSVMPPSGAWLSPLCLAKRPSPHPKPHRETSHPARVQPTVVREVSQQAAEQQLPSLAGDNPLSLCDCI